MAVGALAPLVRYVVLDANGAPASGAKAYFFASGTDTPLVVYSDASLLTPRTNPVEADAAGVLPPIYFSANAYRVRIDDADGSVIYPATDNVYDFAQVQLSASGGSALIGFIQAGAGAVARTAQSKMREFRTLEDYGAVGDGVTDDTQAFVDALAAADGGWVLGHPDANYRLTATLALNGDRFDGRGCTITKDVADVGVSITGGALYSYLQNVTVIASASQTATDYDAAANDHGVVVTGTRVQIRNVTSSGHKGAGFYLDSTGGNMNKSVYEEIRGNANSLAGCYLLGTTDNMSVWLFSAYVQSNFGWGVYATDTCALRQSVLWIYSESNAAGASFPSSQFVVDLQKIRTCDIWAYVEQQSAASELRLGASATVNRVESVRRNLDADLGSDNAWEYGNATYIPSGGSATGTTQVFSSLSARTNQSGEYFEVPFVGSGGNFGYLRGQGNAAAGQQYLKVMSATRTLSVDVNDVAVTVPAAVQFDLSSTANNTRMAVWDVTAGALRRVTIGANDSGGAGFRVLRIPN